MNGRIPGFKFNPKKHLAHFSLYIPKSGGKLRRERTVQAATREEALRLWQVFRDEISGKPTLAPPAEPPVMTFRTFVDTYLKKICVRRAKKTLAIYRTIATSRLIPTFGDKALNAIRTCDVEDFMAATPRRVQPRVRQQLCTHDEGAPQPCREASHHSGVTSHREDHF
jgi:hypothetical protein